MRNLIKGLGLSALLAIVVTAPAYAVTTTTTFTVTASVVSGCSIGTVSTLAFGVYSPVSGSTKDATTTVSVTCTLLTSYNIGLNAGTTTGGSVSQRKLQGVTPANTLNYNLYVDSGHATVWGNTVGTDTAAGIGTGIAQGYVVYGQIPANAAASIDTYSDTITVTVTY